jgi:hypothetical protein|tara:strand:- start:30 stop:374 length:345 start_codon:yes stop_codon:yes gene_type:complete
MKTEDLKEHIERAVQELANRSVPDLLDILTHWAREAGGPRYAWDLTRSSSGYTLCVYDSESDVIFDQDGESASLLVAKACVQMHRLNNGKIAAASQASDRAIGLIDLDLNRPKA